MENELNILVKTKEALLDQGSILVRGNMYELLIEAEHWHNIFKTDEAKLKGLHSHQTKGK